MSGYKRRVIVLGATGFIGRNLVEQLSLRDDLEVFATWHERPPFERTGVKWMQANLLLDGDVRRVLHGMDVVVQAAATTSGSADIISRPHIHVTDNAVMNSLILRACHDLHVSRFIFLSCSVMYASSAEAVSEDAPLDYEAIHDKYFGVAWTKLYVEKLCQFYSRIGSLSAVAIRHSNVYGAHDKFDLARSHVFGASLTKVMTARKSIVVWGDGKEGRDLLHVDDLCQLVSLLIDVDSLGFTLLNAGSGHAVSVDDLVTLMIKTSGRHLRIYHDFSKPTIPTTVSLDYSKAYRLLGWEPRMSLKEGVKETMKWWTANVKDSPGED